MERNKDEYIPNKVPLWNRLKNLFISAFFIIYGGYGVWVNDLAIKLGRYSLKRKIYHLHDEAAVVMYIGLLLVSLCFFSEIIDHYDRRDNEHLYHKIANYTLWPGIIFCVTALFIN